MFHGNWVIPIKFSRPNYRAGDHDHIFFLVVNSSRRRASARLPFLQRHVRPLTDTANSKAFVEQLERSRFKEIHCLDLTSFSQHEIRPVVKCNSPQSNGFRRKASAR